MSWIQVAVVVGVIYMVGWVVESRLESILRSIESMDVRINTNLVSIYDELETVKMDVNDIPKTEKISTYGVG